MASVGIEDEDGTVFEGDFDWLSGWEALVEQVAARLRIVVWDPFADGLPGWFDGLEGFDVEGRVRRWREVDDALPHSVEAEEELDFSGADDGADALHGGLTTGALERVGAPDAEDEVAPERTDGACGDFGWWRDDRRLGCAWFFDVGFLRWRAARHPAAFVCRIKYLSLSPHLVLNRGATSTMAPCRRIG